MSRQKKCVICGKPIISDNDAVPYKGRYAHNSCFDISLKVLQTDKEDKVKDKKKTSKKPKPKIELKDAMSEEEYADKKEYYSYLRTLLDNELNAKIYALSDQYIKKYGFTFKEMYLTLQYLYEIKQREIVGDIVGLIPYYFAEAQDYYKTLENIKTNNADKDISSMYKNKIVHVGQRSRKTKLIDITTIGGNKDV